MVIAGCELKIPDEFPGLGIERELAVRVQVVAGAERGVEVGIRVAGAPINQSQIGIVGSDSPGIGTAQLPGISGPGLVTRLPGSCSRVEPPTNFAGGSVVGTDEPASWVI